MQIIQQHQALRPYACEPETVHGTTWRHIFRVRNGVAYQWFQRYRELIPLEEFQSEGNLAIVQAMRTYEPGRPPPFGIYLTKVLHKRLASVPRHEWKGFVTYERSDERTAWGKRKELRRIIQRPPIDPLPAIEIDDASADYPQRTPLALQTVVPYEQQVTIREALQFLHTHVSPKRGAYLHATLHEVMPTEIAQADGVKPQTVQTAIARTQARLRTWAEEVHFAES